MASRPKLARDARGQIYGEYLIIVSLVSLVVALAIYGLGRPFLEFFRQAQGVILLPV